MSRSASRLAVVSVLIIIAQVAGCPGRVESLLQTNNEKPGATGPTNGEPVVNDPIVVADPARVVNMGTNITDVYDASTELHFTDVFMASRGWISQPADGMQPWDNEMTITTDTNGWVTALAAGQAVATLMVWDIDGHYPLGQYVVVYDGEGTLEFDFGVEVVSRRTGGDGQPNVIVINVPAAGEGIYMRISATDPQGVGDYIRNIKVWMPGVVDPDNPNVEPASPFYSVFLDNVRPYRSLRFMNWGRVIETTLSRWADRTTTQSARQSGDSGVAVEYMIMLANELQRDPWFCMPHVADDDFVRRFAEMVRDNLDFSDPQRKVYIEYSNEIWNPIFSMNQYCREQGVAAGLILDDDDDDYNASLRYQAQRSAEIS